MCFIMTPLSVWSKGSSGRNAALVVLLQADPAVPERRGRLQARGAGNKQIEVHVPARPDLEQRGAVGQAAMDHGKQHLAAPGLQLEGDVSAVLPGDAELARRIQLGDAALHAM